MAQQLKGVVMPYVESQKGEKALIVSSKAKRFAAYGALRRVGSQFFLCVCVLENQWKSNLLQLTNVQMVICSCFPTGTHHGTQLGYPCQEGQGSCRGCCCYWQEVKCTTIVNKWEKMCFIYYPHNVFST